MTVSQLRRGRWMVALAILTTVSLLLAALVAIGPQLLEDVGARYTQPSYAPEQAEYCPGDVLHASYQVAPREPGPVEIMGAWCNVDRGNCLLNDTTVRYGIIADSYPAISTTLSVTVPTSAQLTAGTRWQYVRSVRRLGQPSFDMFTVPFTIADGCD